MARHGYVNYSTRQRRKKNLVFFIISAITIIVGYVVVRQFWSKEQATGTEPAVSRPVTQVPAEPEVVKPSLRSVETSNTPKGSRKAGYFDYC